jgi:hypothetical protein
VGDCYAGIRPVTPRLSPYLNFFRGRASLRRQSVEVDETDWYQAFLQRLPKGIPCPNELRRALRLRGHAKIRRFLLDSRIDSGKNVCLPPEAAAPSYNPDHPPAASPQESACPRTTHP